VVEGNRQKCVRGPAVTRLLQQNTYQDELLPKEVLCTSAIINSYHRISCPVPCMTSKSIVQTKKIVNKSTGSYQKSQSICRQGLINSYHAILWINNGDFILLAVGKEHCVSVIIFWHGSNQVLLKASLQEE
jgi:hypothetical protein